MPVSQTKQKDLEKRMQELGIFESDIREHFIRSSGAGGQNVNKVSTCVALKHIPTGLEVKCQKERSQALNRFLARRLLVEKIERKILGEKSKKEMQIWKLRKQKKHRSKKAKEKVLENKHLRSDKKEMRKKIRLSF
jgi:protein subunit release factor B